MKKQELIELINSEKAYSLLEAEGLIPRNVACVANGLEVSKHRWFNTAVDVYECEDGFVGIWGVNEIFSEYMCAKDCEYECGAQEYEAVQTITYKPKQ